MADEERMKRLFYFSVAVLLALILFWFGSRFLFFPSVDISGGLLLMTSIGLILGGVFMLASGMGEAWRIVAALVGLGLYFGARATGLLELPWLARLLGLACWLTALFALYLAWPNRTISKLSDKQDEPK